jgi:hypothetical protein
MRRAAYALFLTVVLCSGCGLVPSSPENDENVPDMNMQEAANRADAILDETINAVTPSVDWQHGIPFDGVCSSDPRDLPYETGSVTRDRFITTIVSESRRQEFLAQIRSHWEGRGFVITGENPNSQSIYASTPADFRLGVGVNTAGQVYFTIATPCFRMSEVAPPTSGPDYTGDEPPLPSVESEYWSE